VKKSELAGQKSSLSKFVLPSDHLADSVVLKNTEYRINMLVVLEVSSQDKITVGWVKKCVIREGKLFFLVIKTDSYRSSLQYFESVGQHTEALASSEDLKAFKPLLPRGTEKRFIFFLCGKLVDD
jgi:hypothetical protein